VMKVGQIVDAVAVVDAEEDIGLLVAMTLLFILMLMAMMTMMICI
jgi:hypothetical protein